MRLIALLVAAALWVPATVRGLTVFDFNDFPQPLPFSELTGAPQTYSYGCDGKAYCTDQEVWFTWVVARRELLTTARDGITLMVYNGPEVVDGGAPNFGPGFRLCNGYAS